MSTPLDYSKLRNATLVSSQDEEAVTVNTRALIDKVLARYSGEWTTLRELIQNAADASASKVVIRFDTLPSSTVPTPASTDDAAQMKHTILHHTLRSLRVSNNGQAFADTDWSRLKRIAEGNPDETKIGAFGVGFYSVFAECEEPFVASGKETMAFFWKGNSLFTRRGKLPDDVPTSETAFILDYRNNTTPVPNLMSICQFLSSSLTFVGLESIELWLDDWNLFTLSKKSAPSLTVAIPKQIETKTKEGMMKITGVESQNAQIDASWTNVVGWIPTVAPAATISEDTGGTAAVSLRSFFSRLTTSTQTSSAARRAAKEEQAVQSAILEDIAGKSHASIFIRISTVQIRTQVPSNFAAELERATKKPPPKTTRIAILTSSYDEQAASLSTLRGTASRKVAEIITSVLPNKNGRVFIGFPTAQTTGLLAHISAPSLIPTVERESIDLNARYVRTWNTELLSVAGIACRIAFGGEMASIQDRLNAMIRSNDSKTISDSDVASVTPAAVHVLKQYTFRESTPLAKAGATIEESFWTSHKRASIEMLSSQGVLSSDDVRIASENLSFVKGIPVVPEQVLKEGDAFLSKIRDYGLISEITMSDIARELEKQALSDVQLEEFLKWAAKKFRTGQYDGQVLQSLFGVTVANVSNSDSADSPTEVLSLGNVDSYINSVRISPDMPMPPNVIPFKFTKGLSATDLQGFGWQELQIVPWLRWLVDPVTRKKIGKEHDITDSAAFAGQVLAVLSKAYDSLSQSSKQTTADLLSPLTIIPTKLGMRRPGDSYFASVKLFDDLPTISGLNSVKEKFLKALGVRKTIELTVIFDRLMKSSETGGSGWSHVDLIRYLVSVWTDIPEQDLVQLRNTPLCPREDAPEAEKSTKRFKMSQLFEPKDSLRGLDLPLLQWPGTWNSFNNEGKFLRALGLRSYPSVPELVDAASKAASQQNIDLFEKTLAYFIDNHYANSYGSFSPSDIQVPFVPIQSRDKLVVVRPRDCFADPRASVLGFNVLRRDLQAHASKLGVLQNPPINDCAIRLIKTPPTDKLSARNLFSYFATRLTDISNNVADRLGAATIVPIAIPAADSSTDRKYRMTTPSSCFLGDGEEYGEIFDYVDFGEEANVFLLKVGSKHEPTTNELTRIVIREPTRILTTLQVDKYLGLLRRLNLNMDALKKDRLLWKDMKTAPFLLCYKDRKPETPAADPSKQAKDIADEEMESVIKDAHLKSANQIAIIDDIKAFSLFREHLFAAPQEEALEELYWNLGSPLLSAMVEQEPKLGPRLGDQKDAERFRDLFLERAQLFLHGQPPTSVRHDTKWLEKNFQVQVVQSVSLRRTLRNTTLSHTERMSAALTGKALLSITRDYEYFHICNEVVDLLLIRPRPQDSMALEMFLSSSLQRLRSRGYNVDRILRKKEAEKSRIAELAKLRKEEEANLRRLAEQQESAQAQDQSTQRGPVGETNSTAIDPSDQRDIDDHPQMPGAFHESPDRARPSLPQQLQARNFFSSLTRRLGLDDASTAAGGAGAGLRNLLTNGQPKPQTERAIQQPANNPPPYSAYDPGQIRGTGHNETVTSPEQVNQNLTSAIAASRAWNSNSVFSRPSANTVKEIASYCDSKPGQNLTLVSTSGSGINIFVDKAVPEPADFVSRNHVGLENFCIVLLDCAQVFNLPRENLHVFYDQSGGTIAFNSNGSVFCNYRFFAQLHQSGMHAIQSRAEATVYWWVTLCHELAHNLVSDHSSDHSFYTEQFVSQYFGPMMGLLSRMAKAAEPSPAQIGGPEQTGVDRAFS